MNNAIEGLAVITGGASGIGAACARRLARLGARVAIVDRDEASAATVAREVGGTAFGGDVGDQEALFQLADRIEAELGKVDILVNSAGVIQMPLQPHSLDMTVWDEVVRIDQRGTYVASLAFSRAMLTRRRGVIVNIASIVGMRSAPLHAYAPAKAAVISMTECLAAEWGPSGIRVNAVAPGYTRTPALQAAIDAGERDVSRLTANAALGRMVEPEEVADAVAFLASRQATAITGVTLPVDAGWLVASTWQTYGGLRTPGAA